MAMPMPDGLHSELVLEQAPIDGAPVGEIPNGVWTIAGPRGHRTFSIDTQGEREAFAAGKRIVSLLAGPDNYHDWTSFGFVSEDSRRVAVWRTKRAEPGTGRASEWEKFARLLEAVFVAGQRVFAGDAYRVTGERTCLRCNRRLTTPDSLAAGIGPECRRKAGGA